MKCKCTFETCYSTQSIQQRNIIQKGRHQTPETRSSPEECLKKNLNASVRRSQESILFVTVLSSLYDTSNTRDAEQDTRYRYYSSMYIGSTG